jgi:hypothetical protein
MTMKMLGQWNKMATAGAFFNSGLASLVDT